ncbi:hypothetical protein EVAR_24197_1 [Eumeta japonica]|uniref:Uncharacterized protein n=1 Tax=Eumeta variegata TaxID=151549 RepID=A0A4C1W753_EUMVA|nr:hypothetical protein EVAR_24197_1 [Eumeta japonica]
MFRKKQAGGDELERERHRESLCSATRRARAQRDDGSYHGNDGSILEPRQVRANPEKLMIEASAARCDRPVSAISFGSTNSDELKRLRPAVKLTKIVWQLYIEWFFVPGHRS